MTEQLNSDPIEQQVDDLIRAGVAYPQIEQTLLDKGFIPKQAEELVANRISQLAVTTPPSPSHHTGNVTRSGGLYDMLIGGAAVGVAAFIAYIVVTTSDTLHLWHIAILSPLVAWGSYRFIEGLWAVITGK